MAIPFIDLSFQTRTVLDEFLARVRELCGSDQFVGGVPVEDFEAGFASYCGAAHCVALNSGTDALRLALAAWGVSGDDEVITSPFTFMASAEAASQTGQVVFADLDPDTFNISPESVREKLTEKSRVLLPVHIFGLPAAMPELAVVAEEKSLILLEDACQAHGAAIDGRRVGALGQAAAFSFYPTKNLGGFGDGGALTCRDGKLAEKVRRLRNHGQTGPYHHEDIGFNSRLDAFQAAVLTLKLRHLDDWIDERRRLARIYREVLSGIGEVSFQKEPGGCCHSYHLLAVLVDRREELIRFLNSRQIDARVIYPTPIHLLPAYRHLNHRKGDFPVAEEICDRVLCLPLYPGMTEAQAVEVADAVRQFYRG
jgi:dTDP-4-amino-4,6-dideoxygalactose transaminase